MSYDIRRMHTAYGIRLCQFLCVDLRSVRNNYANPCAQVLKFLHNICIYFLTYSSCVKLMQKFKWIILEYVKCVKFNTNFPIMYE